MNSKWLKYVVSLTIALLLASLGGCASESFKQIDKPLLINGVEYNALRVKSLDPWSNDVTQVFVLGTDMAPAAPQQAPAPTLTATWPRIGDTTPPQNSAPVVQPQPQPQQVGGTQMVIGGTYGSEGGGKQAFIGLIGAGGRAAGGCLSASRINVSGGNSSSSSAAAAAAESKANSTLNSGGGH